MNSPSRSVASLALLFIASTFLSAGGAIMGPLGKQSTADQSGQVATFQWPDSRVWNRMLVNVNQYIETYLANHPDWFTHDRVVLDFRIVNVTDYRQAESQYKATRTLLER